MYHTTHIHTSPPPFPLYPHTPQIQHMFMHTSTQPPIPCTITQTSFLNTRPQSMAAPLLTSSSVTELRRFLIIMMVLGSGSAVFCNRATQEEGNEQQEEQEATWSHCEVACSPKLLLTSQHCNTNTLAHTIQRLKGDILSFSDGLLQMSTKCDPNPNRGIQLVCAIE